MLQDITSYAIASYAAAALALIGFAPFAWKRFLTYLHIFQQEEYDGPRFLRWMIRSGSFDTRVSIAIIVLALLSKLVPAPALVLAFFIAVVFVVSAYREADPRKVGKKKLAMTQRAIRIVRLAAAILLVLGIVGVALSLQPAWIVVLVQAIPISLVAAVKILQPQENRIQQRFWNEAHEKLKRLAPVIVGVTGSYGKTSTKHILGHLLESAGSALITPGSVNTPMGISRIVRERLEPYHRHFVVEMGAYGPGSIERLCRLAPPDIAVVTAVGPAHYERFKSLDSVARTKFELPAAAIARNGKAIINDAVLAFADARSFTDAHRASMVLVGQGEGSDAEVRSVTQGKDGLTVALTYQGVDYTLFAPLYGLHHGGNMALAFVTALAMGIDAETAQIAMKSTPQISHRLEVKRQGDGTTIIDDGYNSNPAGFASALDLLPLLVSGEGRRILVTPGMVELGEAHAEEHRKLGTKAGEAVDILLAVAPDRIRDFIDAYRVAKPGGEIVECAGFAQAQAWMGANLKPGDAILIENDLPDLYERTLAVIADRKAFILGHTRLVPVPYAPEISLHVADEVTPLWQKTEDELGRIGLPPPFWAFAWAGGQALARYLLDQPEAVAGLRVLDFASGSGLVAIAAAMAGAASVHAADIDGFALDAIVLNARANNVAVMPVADNMLGRFDIEADVILAGDIFYDRDIAAEVLAWLESWRRRGAAVLIGDPGRTYLPKERLTLLATYEVPVSRELEDLEIKKSSVWTLKG